MKKILILGAGLVARPMIRYLLEKNYLVTVASNTPDRAGEMISGYPGGLVIDWSAEDESGLDRLISEHDLTVSLLPYTFHVMVARHCLAHHKNMVTTSYVKPEMKALDEAAHKAGIIILNETGLDPGIDHMSAMRIIDKIHSGEGAVLEFYSLCGALPAPEAANNPFRYKFSWSPKGVIMAGNNDARFLKHGKIIELPTRDLFKNPVRVAFPGIGILEVYPNRDSLAYKELYDIPETQTMFRGTFRYPGWCETLDLMKRLGLTGYEKLDMSGRTYAGLMALLIGSPDSSGIRNKVARHIGIPEDACALDALSWLGFFDEIPLNRTIESPFEITSDRMIEKMSLEHDDRDMVVMQHTFLAAYPDGHKEVIRSRMLDFGTLATDTSIARTVALPAAIGAEMILNEEIKVKGVHIPVIPEIYNPILDQLEQLGIRMTEEYGLPLTDNIC